MNFFIPANKIKKIYNHEGNCGCFVSNRIMIDGCKVGYMYRELSDSEFPDSGWRFFSGDESEEYTNNYNNFSIVNLNTVCNYDKSIIPYLNYPVGSELIRKGEYFKLDN